MVFPVVSSQSLVSNGSVSQPSHASSTHPLKEAFIPSPEPYTRELGSCRQFLLQCTLVFEQQTSSYYTDRSSIAYIINFLWVRAGQWARALWGSSSASLESCMAFVSELGKIFNHPVQGQKASKRLLWLWQENSSVSSYSVDLHILAAESGGDESALQGVFVRGLSEELKDNLAFRDELTTLKALISLAIKIDNRLREMWKEKLAGPSK